MGERYWLRRDEADCRAHGRRNDYLHDSRADFGSRFLRVDEGTSIAEGHVAAEVSGVKEAGMPRGAIAASCPFVFLEKLLGYFCDKDLRKL